MDVVCILMLFKVRGLNDFAKVVCAVREEDQGLSLRFFHHYNIGGKGRQEKNVLEKSMEQVLSHSSQKESILPPL